MTDDTTLGLWYYVLGQVDSGSGYVEVDRSGKVNDLKVAIATKIGRDKREVERLPRLIKLYQVEFVNDDRPEKPASDAVNKLKATMEIPWLNSATRLSEWWPSAPEEMMIHIVVELPIEFGARISPPPLQPEELEHALLTAYKPFQSKLKEFIQRDWNSQNLSLFDNLGNVVTAERRKSVFNALITTIVFNVSGTGKTRMLLDGLCHNWGIYFVLSVKDSVGSLDLSSAENSLPKVSNWSASDLETDENHLIASRWLATLLCARLFVLLQLLRSIPSSSSAPVAARTQWTLLQCFPPTHANDDIFKAVANSIRAATKEAVDQKIIALCRELGVMKTYFPEWDPQYPLRSLHLFIVLDEAQAGLTTLPTSFQSVTALTRQPFLHAFYRYFQERGDVIGIVLSGTAFSFKDLYFGDCSQVAKPLRRSTRNMKIISEVGRFVGDSHLLYAQNHLDWLASTIRLKERIQYWFPGRHRLAAGLVQALRTTPGQESPHRMLTLYVYNMTGFTVTDGEDLEATEPELDVVMLGETMFGRLLPVPIERIPREVYNALIDVFMRWSIASESTMISLDKNVQSLISYGVGYLANTSNPPKVESEDLETVVAKKTVHFIEPLMFLRLAVLLGGDGRREWMNAQLQASMEKTQLGSSFEQVMMLTLMDNFNDGYTTLGTIFHLGGASAKLRVRLIALKKFADGELAAVPVTWTTGCRDRWGYSANAPTDSLKYFAEPPGIPFLLPDRNMGPDLFFFGQTEDSNELVAFGVQCRIREHMPAGNWISAQSTLEWEDFYKIKKGNQKIDYAHKKDPHLNERVVSALSKLLDGELSPPTANSIRSRLRSSKTKRRKTVKYIALVAATNDDTVGTNVTPTETFGVVRTELFENYLGSMSSVLTEPKPPAAFP